MGWSSRVVKEYKKESDTNILGPKNVQPNSIDIVEGKRKGGWAKGLADESRDRGTPPRTKKKGMREGTHPCQWKKKTTYTTYQPFCDDGLRDRACEQSEGPRAGSWPNWLIHLCCFAGTGRLHKPFAGESARPLAAGRREPPWAPSRARELPESWPSWTARLNRAEWAKTRSETCFRESSQGAHWWRGITWGWRGRKEILGGTLHEYTFLSMEKRSSHE